MFCYRIDNDEKDYDSVKLEKSDLEIYSFVTNNSKKIISRIVLFFKGLSQGEHIIYVSAEYDYWGEDTRYIRSICLITNFGSIYFEYNNEDIFDIVEQRENNIVPKKIMDIFLSDFSIKHRKYRRIVEKIKKISQNIRDFNNWYDDLKSI
jgi:hypothetical protein